MLRLTAKEARALTGRITASDVLDEALRQKKPNKFKAKGQRINGEWFASKAELTRWRDLQHLHAAGKIEMLRRQVPVKLMIGGRLIATIIWDASYVRDSQVIYEDVKGAKKTHAYKLYALKRNLFLALFPNTVVIEVVRGKETRHC